MKENEQSSEKNSALQFKNKIDKADAKKMIEDFHKKKSNLQFAGNVWALFDKARMAQLYTDQQVEKVYFFIGVIDDPNPKKKDAPVIIMQVQRSTPALKSYEYFTGDSFCPPPNDGSCGTIENPA